MLHGILGSLFFVLLAWLLSENRGKFNVKRVGIGLLFQLVVAFLFLKLPILSEALLGLNRVVQAIEKATSAGATFMFGYLSGGPTPFEVANAPANFIIAFKVLPIILVTSALSAVLFHWGILQKIVSVFSRLLQKTLGIGGVLGFGVASNVYMGVVEAPLLVKPYLSRISRSDLFVIMSAGMATVAGTVMVLYASILNPILPGAIGHILIASVMSAPAVIILGQILIPPDDVSSDADNIVVIVETKSALDALVRGTMEGIQLLLNVAAMIVVLFALVNLCNQVLGLLPFENPITLQTIFGAFFYPISWLIGVPTNELAEASRLLGTKVVLNEFVSYSQMAAIPTDALSAKSRMILTYAMCGFANFASVGLIIGALGTLVPERRSEIVGLAFKSLLVGVFATCMTGAIAGALI